VRDLNRFESGTAVDRHALVEAGVIGSIRVPVKLLGSGALERALTVRLDRASAGARQKVTAAGGSIHLTGDGTDDAASDDPAADESN
jgi:large subunit ribosomal protein L15